ncbi:MAG: hypothetical protein ACLUQ6_00765 [Alistipes onderdonkii]
MLIVLLLLLAAVAAAASALLWLVVRGHNKPAAAFGSSHAVASDTPGGIGISVLCSGVHAQEQVENLSARYAHYGDRVVLAIPALSRRVCGGTARYRMIRVEYAALSEELPVTERACAGAFAQTPFPQAGAGGPCAGDLPPAISMRRPKWRPTITCCRCREDSFCCRTRCRAAGGA